MKCFLNKIIIIVILLVFLILSCRKKNRPPYTPCPPSGPSIGVINKVYRFGSKTIDPNEDSIAIRFDWGDGETSDWSELVESDEAAAMSHFWPKSDNYNVRVQAKDKKELYSKWSLPLIIEITENQPPVISTPSGPMVGSVNSLYQFSCLAIDPHGDDVAIRFDWGGGDTSDWSNFSPSGRLMLITHYWHECDTFQIKAQAVDKNGLTSEWSQEHQIIITSGGQPGTLKWFYYTGIVTSSPAISVDGTIYIPTFRLLTAINLQGMLRWKYEVNDVIGIRFSPVIGIDGTIFIIVSNSLTAINQQGTLKWNYEISEGIGTIPAIGIDGTIYVGSMDNCLYALNPDGTFKWQCQINSSISSSPSIGIDGTIYIGTNQSLVAINSNGTLKWFYSIGQGISSSPAIDLDGIIYVGSFDSCLYAINPKGELKWKYQTNNKVASSPVFWHDGTVYFGSDDKNLYALNQDGMLKWQFYIDASIIYSPALDSHGNIYFTTLHGYIYALKPDGTLNWRFYTWRTQTAPAIGFDGTIYVGSNYFYALYGSGPLADSPWPMFRHDLKHTGRVGGGKN